jgi:hypothetical protein
VKGVEGASQGGMGACESEEMEASGSSEAFRHTRAHCSDPILGLNLIDGSGR